MPRHPMACVLAVLFVENPMVHSCENFYHNRLLLLPDPLFLVPQIVSPAKSLAHGALAQPYWLPVLHSHRMALAASKEGVGCGIGISFGGRGNGGVPGGGLEGDSDMGSCSGEQWVATAIVDLSRKQSS